MSGKMIILVLALLIFVSFPAAGEVYTVYLDREFGFWAIRSNDLNQSLNYSSRTLNIDTGDSVQWMNMDSEGERITIMSDNTPVSYTHLRAHETRHDLVCRLLLEKKKNI